MYWERCCCTWRNPTMPPEVDEPPSNNAGIGPDGLAHIVVVIFIIVVIAAPFLHPFPLPPPANALLWAAIPNGAPSLQRQRWLQW